jgi:hypothetical protein
MAGGYGIPTPGGNEALVAELSDMRKRLSELERPTGSQTAQALKKLTDLVNGLVNQTTINVTGTATIGSDITTTGGYIFTPLGYAFDITYTRRGAWLGNDGRLGWASSSVTAKELIDTIPSPDPIVILALADHYYQRKAEIEKRDDPSSPDYVGPDYQVATEWGGLAEEFHEAGLWQVVIYEWTTEYELRPVVNSESGEPFVDEDGNVLKERIQPGKRVGDPRPVGIHYEMVGLLTLVALRYVWAQHQELAMRVSAIEEAQGL